jgi:hypothetical protein
MAPACHFDRLLRRFEREAAVGVLAIEPQSAGTGLSVQAVAAGYDLLTLGLSPNNPSSNCLPVVRMRDVTE